MVAKKKAEFTVRTLRFYVDESILPPPKKVGKAPVYEEEWILNALLCIHLMKTRLSRSLTEIRTVLGRLQEDPTHLADKLSVLYEEYVRTEHLKPLERSGLQDAFFNLLCGKLGPGVQPSEVRLTALADSVLEDGRWEGERCCEVHVDTLGVFFGRRLASTLYVVLFVL